MLAHLHAFSSWRNVLAAGRNDFPRLMANLAYPPSATRKLSSPFSSREEAAKAGGLLAQSASRLFFLFFFGHCLKSRGRRRVLPTVSPQKMPHRLISICQLQTHKRRANHSDATRESQGSLDSEEQCSTLQTWRSQK